MPTEKEIRDKITENAETMDELNRLQNECRQIHTNLAMSLPIKQKVIDPTTHQEKEAEVFQTNPLTNEPFTAEERDMVLGKMFKKSDDLKTKVAKLKVK